MGEHIGTMFKGRDSTLAGRVVKEMGSLAAVDALPLVLKEKHPIIRTTSVPALTRI